MKTKTQHLHQNSDHLKGKLNSYSALAGSFLICSAPAYGAVQYTDVDPDLQILTTSSFLNIDVNNDAINDLQFYLTFNSVPSFDLTIYELKVRGLNPNNGVAVPSFPGAAAYGSGEVIDGNLNFQNYGMMAKEVGTAFGSSVQGPWLNARFKNLGFKFVISGQTHYGWARLSVVPTGTPFPLANIFLHDYAWESTPNTAIVTPPLPACESPDSIAITNLRFQSAIYNWETVPTAERYEIRGREVAGPPGYSILTVDDAFQTSRYFSYLTPDTDYEVSIRTICFGDVDTSQWSTPMIFHTHDCVAPDSIYTTDLTSTSVKLNWSPAPLEGSPIRHQIYGRPVGNTTPVSLFAPASSTSLQVNNLTPGTSYEWAVRLHCQNILYSSFSTVNMFTTLNPAQKNAKQITPDNTSSIIIAPHPVAGSSRVLFENDGSVYQLSIRDMNGKVVRTVNGITTSEVELDKGDLAPGIYLLELKGKKYYVEKIVVE